MILVGVLDVIYDTISSVLKGSVETKAIFESLELVLLTIDEVVCSPHCVIHYLKCSLK